MSARAAQGRRTCAARAPSRRPPAPGRRHRADGSQHSHRPAACPRSWPGAGADARLCDRANRRSTPPARPHRPQRRVHECLIAVAATNPLPAKPMAPLGLFCPARGTPGTWGTSYGERNVAPFTHAASMLMGTISHATEVAIRFEVPGVPQVPRSNNRVRHPTLPSTGARSP